MLMRLFMLSNRVYKNYSQYTFYINNLKASNAYRKINTKIKKTDKYFRNNSPNYEGVQYRFLLWKPRPEQKILLSLFYIKI